MTENGADGGTAADEIYIDREETTKRHKELLAEHVELRRRNRLLEAWILKYIKKTQEKVMPTVDEHLKEHMEQMYIQALYTYERQLGDITGRRARITADMQTHEGRARELREEDARLMDEFLDREREVATGLIYAKTGRKITEKVVNEITRRQVSRRAALVRGRYEHIFLRRRLDDVKTQVQSLETLGDGMTAADYETLRMSYAACRDKLDERDREIEKLRHKIAEAVNGVAHCKEKETCLADDIEFEGRELDEYREQTARAREDVNRLHLILRDLRRTYDEKRLEAGLMMAQPVLREMERTMRSLDVVRNDIEIIKREIQPRGPARRQEQRDDVDDDAGQTGVVSK